MEPIMSVHLLSISERLNRLRTRIYLESVSGIPASDKEAFLVFCREREMSTDAGKSDLSDWLKTRPIPEGEAWGGDAPRVCND